MTDYLCEQIEVNRNICTCFHEVFLLPDYYRIIPFKKPIPDKVFVGNVSRTEKVSDEESCTCRVKCYLEPNCVSINVGPAEKDGHLCQISNATDNSVLRSSLTTKQRQFHLAIEV